MHFQRACQISTHIPLSKYTELTSDKKVCINEVYIHVFDVILFHMIGFFFRLIYNNPFGIGYRRLKNHLFSTRDDFVCLWFYHHLFYFYR